MVFLLFLIHVAQTPNSNDVFIAWFKRDQTELKMLAGIFVIISAIRLPHAALNNKPPKKRNYLRDANLFCLEIIPVTRMKSSEQIFFAGLVPQTSVFRVK